MSQENVDAVREIYERWSEGDFRAAADLFAPHVVLVLSGQFGPESSEALTFFGAEAIADYTREQLLDTWAEYTMEAEGIIAAGDSVLVDVHQHGVGRTSGVPTEMRFFTLWSFRGPKVIRIESFRERAHALEAAGLSE